MTIFDFRFEQIWVEIRKLRKEKTNTCATEDLMNRINYLETTVNDLIRTVQRLGINVQQITQSELELIDTILTDNNWSRQVENNEYLDKEAKEAALRKTEE